MRIQWLPASRLDIERLYEFLARVNPPAAARKIDQVLDAVERLPDFPKAGQAVQGMEPQDVRSWIVDDYEIRYEVVPDTIIILRIWHTRENR